MWQECKMRSLVSICYKKCSSFSSAFGISICKEILNYSTVLPHFKSWFLSKPFFLRPVNHWSDISQFPWFFLYTLYKDVPFLGLSMINRHSRLAFILAKTIILLSQKYQRHNISEDTWQQLLAFSRCVNEDLEGYDPRGTNSFYMIILWFSPFQLNFCSYLPRLSPW